MESFAELGHQAEKMDRMYRYARHVYDLTRKYYLLGRDAMLDQIGQSRSRYVLEIGCGTGRNLIILSQRLPDAHLYGLDASDMMLQTARHAVRRRGLGNRITLRQGLAEKGNHRETFGLRHSFDAIFFSYVLSMMPNWCEAVNGALEALEPRGRLYIADFWDQAALPSPCGHLLRRWLGSFNVYHRPELLHYLCVLSDQKAIDISISSHARRYAFIAQATKLNGS